MLGPNLIPLATLGGTLGAVVGMILLFGVAVAYADSVVVINSTVHNLIGNVNGPNTNLLTKVTGERGVDITARNPDFLMLTTGGALAVALIPPQGWDPIQLPTSSELVDVDQNVRIVAGSRSEGRASILCPSAPRSCLESGGTGLQRGSTLGGYDKAGDPALALYVDVSSGEDDANDIRWDADVLILGGRSGSPLLVVDDTGTIQALNNVTVWANANETGALGLGDPVGTDYFVCLGGQAYGALAAEHRLLHELYAELAMKFVLLADVLSEVSEQCSLADDSDLLRLYERWQESGSRRSAEVFDERHQHCSPFAQGDGRRGFVEPGRFRQALLGEEPPVHSRAAWIACPSRSAS